MKHRISIRLVFFFFFCYSLIAKLAVKLKVVLLEYHWRYAQPRTAETLHHLHHAVEQRTRHFEGKAEVDMLVGHVGWTFGDRYERAVARLDYTHVSNIFSAVFYVHFCQCLDTHFATLDMEYVPSGLPAGEVI